MRDITWWRSRRAALTLLIVVGGSVAACTDDDRGPGGRAGDSTHATADEGDSEGPPTRASAADPARPGAVDVVQAVRRSSDCRFDLADRPTSVAFCDPFDEANADPTRRSGDLDATIWGVSRVNTMIDWNQRQLNDWAPVPLGACGSEDPVSPPNDVRVCDGRLFEAVSDQGGQTTLAMYPKQPFDIDGRTGTVVFDVSADSAGPHNAWPEFWWTDLPVPAPHGKLAANHTYARNSFGFSIARDCTGTTTGIDQVMITRDYRFEVVPFTPGECVTRSTAQDVHLNHFEVRISPRSVDIYGTDPGATELKLMAHADVEMPLTRGVIWLEDVHYNACKPGFGVPQCVHTFAWDNVGFDGPTPYRDLTFDVPDASPTQLGYRVVGEPRELDVRGVYWLQPPTETLIGFNWFPVDTLVPSVRVNGGDWHTVEWPFDDETYAWRTIAIEVPFDDVRTGDNTVEFASDSPNGTLVSNVNLILIAGAPVP